MVSSEGVPVFDADAEVHRLQGPGGALVPAIEERFPGTTGPDGVDREKIGAAVFGNKGELQALEQKVHPAVRNADRKSVVLGTSVWVRVDLGGRGYIINKK